MTITIIFANIHEYHLCAPAYNIIMITKHKPVHIYQNVHVQYFEYYSGADPGGLVDGETS